MTLIKIIIVVTILILLRSHLSFLKPYWHVVAGFLVGAIAGWLMVSVLIALKVNVEHDLSYLGCPAGLVRPIFAFIGGLVAVTPISIALRLLFPYREDDSRDAR